MIKPRICGDIIVLSMMASIGWAETIKSKEIIISANLPIMTGGIQEYKAPIKVEKKEEEMQISKSANTAFKAYMDYRFITNRSSTQWKMQQSAVTNEHGIRTYNGLYMVAVGTGLADSCGIKLRITLSSGTVILAITGDIKDNRHTDSSNKYDAKNRSMLEFIVDAKKISSKCKTMGDMSSANMYGEVNKIEKIVEGE